MSLPILALFSRQLRGDARLGATYWTRGSLLGLTLGAVVVAHVLSSRLAAVGLVLFQGIAYVVLFFVTLDGVAAFAAVITEEKEQETLGLLKMSRLGAVAILFGKSTSRLVGSLLLLLAQVPFALLAVTLGGVSLDQIAGVYAALFAYMVLLCNLALFASVFCRTTKRAVALTSVLVMAFLGLGPAGGAILARIGLAGWPAGRAWAFHALDWLASALTAANPVVRFTNVFATAFTGPVVEAQVVSNLIASLAFFLLSWWTFERFTREQKPPEPSSLSLTQSLSLRRWLGVGRVWQPALAWKDFHFQLGGRVGLAAKSAVFAAGILALAYFRWTGDDLLPPDCTIGGTAMIAALVLAGLEVCAHATGMFRREIERGTLPLLFLLPVSTRRLVGLKLCGVLPSLVPNAVCFLVGALLHPRGIVDGLAFFLSAGGLFLLFQYVGFVTLLAYTAVVTRRSHVGLVQIGYLAAAIILTALFFVTRRVNLIAYAACTLVSCAALYGLSAALLRNMSARLGERLIE